MKTSESAKTARIRVAIALEGGIPQGAAVIERVGECDVEIVVRDFDTRGYDPPDDDQFERDERGDLHYPYRFWLPVGVDRA